MKKLIDRINPEEGSFLEVFKFWDLLVQLVTRDIKLKYRRSFLGYLWSILNPLMIMIIMTVVFSFLFSDGVEYFPLYLLAGRTMFEFIAGATDKALWSITDNAGLLKKTYVSKFMFTIAKITSTMIDFLFSLGAMVIVMLVYSIINHRILFSFMNLGFLIPFVEAYIFSVGAGLILAELHVFFRDIRYIYNAGMTAIMYASAMFYSLDMFYKNGEAQIAAGATPYAIYLAKFIEHFNPFYIYMKQIRYFLWAPTLSTGVPYWAQVHVIDFVLGFFYAFLMLAIGISTFKKSQDKFILYI
ncbi:MAG: ABC transporter permease [Clostridia bacterium]|nr:ABC transporter permease [Clostridia bacterium]